MKKKLRVLLAEDEKSIRDVLKVNLELDNYEVHIAINGVETLKAYNNQRFDIILLDVMMPDISGFDICQKIRLTNKEIPIIFLTAKNLIKDKIEGLKRGADDYLTKPFSFEELSLRINNLIKRVVLKEQDVIETYSFGGNHVNFRTFEATGQNGDLMLTQKEALLLKLLIENKNDVVSRKVILENVWDYDVFPSTRTIDNFIVGLRKYFEKIPKSPEHFLSVRGVGYKFIDH